MYDDDKPAVSGAAVTSPHADRALHSLFLCDRWRAWQSEIRLYLW